MERCRKRIWKCTRGVEEGGVGKEGGPEALAATLGTQVCPVGGFAPHEVLRSPSTQQGREVGPTDLRPPPHGKDQAGRVRGSDVPGEE